MRGDIDDRDWVFAADPAERVLADVAAGRPRPPRSIDAGRLELAHRHGLVGLLDVSDVVDPAELSAIQARLAARGAVMRRHLGRLVERLGEAGVKVAVVKGPDLADRVYPDPAMRYFTDLDLVVPPSDLDRALDVIDADPACVGIPPKGPQADKRDIVFRDPTGVRFTVDLHWDLFSYTQLRGRAAGTMEAAWERAEAPDPARPHLGWRLADETVAAFLCTHALLDHRFRLVLFRDLAEVARRGLAWDELVAVARRAGLAGFAHLAWTVAAALGAPVPESALAGLATGGLALRIACRLLPRTDLVRFDGRRTHPLNLAIMLQADTPRDRMALAVRAPVAYRSWRKRVGGDAPAVGEHTPSVVVLVTSDRRRGAEVFGRRLVDGLQARAWDARLVALRSGGAGAGVAVEASLAGQGASDVAVVRALRSYLKAVRPDVVVANGGATLRTLVAATRVWRRRPRTVYSSIGEPSYWLRSRRHGRLQRLLIGRCDHVTAVSEETRRQLIDLMGVPPQRVTTAPTGVPESWFRLAPPEEHPELRVLVAGALAPEKDPLTAARAVREAASDIEVTARIAGDGPLRARLEEVAGDDIELLGSVADMEPLFAWCDVLMSTSLTEGLPGVVLEAAAAGRPVVASSVGGTAEVVEDGVSGLLVEPGDVTGFAAALRELGKDPERRRRMGAAGRELARRYTLDTSIDRYETILRGLIDV